MAVRSRVNDSLKEAMRSKDQTRLSTLRLINAAIKDRDIAKRSETAGEAGEQGASDAEVQAILAKMVKQRHDSIRAYEEGGRVELAEQERAEIAIIEEFLPRPLSESETEAAIDEAISDTGATSVRDMGRVMGLLKERHAGRLDFARVGSMVKSRLA